MLPSTGLFKNIPCPYFEDSHCDRPFCHFKHVAKKEEVHRPTYHATPIASHPEPPPEFESARKKPRLEYLPIPTSRPTATYKATAINRKDDASSYIPTVSEVKAPSTCAYVPSKISPNVGAEILPGNENKFPDDPAENNCEAAKNHESVLENQNKLPDDPAEVNREADKNYENGKLPEDPVATKLGSETTEGATKSSKESATEQKQKGDGKHSSSSERKDKSSKHRSSSSSKKSSSSSRSHHKSSHHKSSSSSSHKHKSHKHKSSSSSRHKSSKSHSTEKKDKKEEEPVVEMNFEPSSEDDIEEQCRQIFEGYTPDEPVAVPAQPKPTKLPEIDDQMPNKRQAHENASNVLRQQTILKPDHSQSAMFTAQRRQDVALHNAMVERKAKDEEIARIEAEIKKREEMQQTPLINPLIFQRPQHNRRFITPISHRMAIEAAKRKVDELNKSKDAQFQRFTPAQTAVKTSGRVAHVPSNLLNDIDPIKLAPPIKEAQNTKISSNVRNQYYRIMVDNCLKIYPIPADAYERAQSEEFAVFQKCKVVSTYKSSSLLAINRLKKEIVNDKSRKVVSHDLMLAGKIGQRSSWSVNNKTKVADSESSLVTIDNCSSSQAYSLFNECILSEKQLEENGFPRVGPSRGRAKLHIPKKAKPQNGKDGENYCARCHKVFNVEIYDEPQHDLCNFHMKRSGFRRGFADNLYYCCQQPSGSDGCCYADYHVTDYLDYDNLVGYVTTSDRDQDEDYVCTKKDIFGLDCEMCYTVVGLELTRITVVDFDEKVVYDQFVRPLNRVIDYNTVFSGINESMLSKPGVKTLPEIQAVLLSMFHSKTILVGHSLESDLKALKLIHNVVVDTSVLYPHKMGPPKKRALKTLCIDHLKKIIQEDDAGHDSAEDALVTIKLVKCYLRNRIVN